MLKMTRMMRKADKKVEAKKIKNMAAQRKKDEATHKEDCQEAKKSRSVLKIMNHWKNIGESSRSAGKSPSNHDSDRISLVRKTASERQESEVRKNDDMVEEDDDNERKTELQARRSFSSPVNKDKNENLGSKKFWIKKTYWSKKNCGSKNFLGPKNILGPNKFLGISVSNPQNFDRVLVIVVIVTEVKKGKL